MSSSACLESLLVQIATMEDSESLQRTTIAICSVFFAIGTISMFVRCYTRFVLRDFWWDDWVMLFGIVRLVVSFSDAVKVSTR